MKLKNILWYIFAIASCLITSNARALTVELPSNVGPASLNDYFSKEPVQEPHELRLKIPVATLAPHLTHKVILLKRVNIYGNTVIQAQELKKFFKPYIGKRVNLDKLAIIAGKITSLYRDQGYIISEATIPQKQDSVETGVLNILIKERSIEHMRIEGPITPALKHILTTYGEQIIASKPLKYKTLVHYVILADNIPGVSVETQVMPWKKTDEGLVIFKVQRKTVDGQVRYGKLGSEIIGPYLLIPELNINSILGAGQLKNKVVTSTFNNSLRYYETTLTNPIDKYGDELRLQLNTLTNKPGSEFRPFKVVGTSTEGLIELTHPLLLESQQRIFVAANFSLQDSEQRILNQLNYKDRQRTVELSIQDDFWDKFEGINIINAGYVQGLGVFNGSKGGDPLLSNAGACPACHYFRLLFIRQQKITDSVDLNFRFDSQYTNKRMLQGMLFNYGGFPMGRAYDKNELSGDKGFNASIEASYKHAFGLKWLQRARFFVYYDYGHVWENVPAGDLATVSLPANLEGQSIGAGIHFLFSRNISGELEAYKPINLPPTLLSKNWRAFYSMIVKF